MCTFIGFLSKDYLDSRNIPFTVGAIDRDNVVLCRQHSCLVTHANIANRQILYQQDKAAAIAAACLVQTITQKEIAEDGKLLKKADAKKAKDDATAKKKQDESDRRALLTMEELAQEKNIAKDKAATVKVAKLAKLQEDNLKIQLARARKAALEIVQNN